MNGMFLERRLAYNTNVNTPEVAAPAAPTSPPAVPQASVNTPNQARQDYQSAIMRLLTGSGIRERNVRIAQAQGKWNKLAMGGRGIKDLLPYAGAGYVLGGGSLAGAALGTGVVAAAPFIGPTAAVVGATTLAAGGGVIPAAGLALAATAAVPVIQDGIHYGGQALQYAWRGKAGNEFGKAGATWVLNKGLDGAKHVGNKGKSVLWNDANNSFYNRPTWWDVSVGPAIAVPYRGIRAQMDTTLAGVGSFGRRISGRAMQGLGFIMRNEVIKGWGNLQVKDSQGIIKNIFSVAKETKDNFIDAGTAFILRPTSAAIRLIPFFGKNLSKSYIKGFSSFTKEIKEGRLIKPLFSKVKDKEERRSANRKSLLPDTVSA